MKGKLFLNKISVQKSTTHGYGVFADKNIKKGELIEECYVLLARGKDKPLENFYFDGDGKYVLLLGYGCIYNHSDEPNADYVISMKRRVARIKAERNIRKGEEIFISYGDEWFTTRNTKPKKLKKASQR